MINNLLLRTGEDVILTKLISIHQPTLKEISSINLSEADFLQAAEMLCVTKDKLGEEISGSLSNYRLLLTLISDPMFPQPERKKIMDCLSLFFPSVEISLTIQGIILQKNEKEVLTLTDEMFSDFQKIVRKVTGLQFIKGDEIEYNATSARAREIQKKLEAGRRKVAQLKQSQSEASGSSILSNYLDILIVGCGLTYQQLRDFTIPQIFFAVDKYQAYYMYELDFRCRMVGGGDKNSQPDNWMLEQEHKK